MVNRPPTWSETKFLTPSPLPLMSAKLEAQDQEYVKAALELSLSLCFSLSLRGFLVVIIYLVNIFFNDTF